MRARSHGGLSRRTRNVPRSDRWMVPYADLVTLLLTLFVVLFVTARSESKGESQAAAPEPSLEPVVSLPEPSAPIPEAELVEVQDDVALLIDLDGLEGAVQTRFEKRGLVITLAEEGFFDAGSASPRAESLPVIDSLARLVQSRPHHVRVEGHTDDTPIHTPRFPSNWELSTARATWLVAHLVENFDIDPSRLSAAGYGEFRPLADNKTASGRARNRRVDLVLLSSAVAGREEPPPAGVR